MKTVDGAEHELNEKIFDTVVQWIKDDNPLVS